jgi:hypothetical protein
MVVDQGPIRGNLFSEPSQGTTTKCLHSIDRTLLNDCVVPDGSKVVVCPAVRCVLEVEVQRSVKDAELGAEAVQVLLQVANRVLPELADGEHLRLAGLTSHMLDKLRDEGGVDVLQGYVIRLSDGKH